MPEHEARPGGPPVSGALGEVHMPPEAAPEDEPAAFAAADDADDISEEDVVRRNWSRQAITIGVAAVVVGIIALIIILQGVYRLMPS